MNFPELVGLSHCVWLPRMDVTGSKKFRDFLERCAACFFPARGVAVRFEIASIFGASFAECSLFGRSLSAVCGFIRVHFWKLSRIGDHEIEMIMPRLA